jgi:chemotaxis protein methyltransferase CheR
MGRAAVGDQALERVANLVRERTRLRVTERNLESLERLVRQRVEASGGSVDEYLARLASGSPESGELEQVTRELTVGETYFFRGPQLSTVREHVLPELIVRARAQHSRELRILSAGCATGEEPYGIVMILSELLPDFESWQIRVVGLDVNRSFLQRAEQGSYSKWSLRDVPEAVIARHFIRDHERFVVRPNLRTQVRFQYANLALDPLPAPALGVVAMDLILCQNVLYYFEHDVREAVAEKLARSLSPEGYLMFGPSDLLAGSVPLCRARCFGDALAFQRTQRLSWSVHAPPSSRPPPSSRAAGSGPMPSDAQAESEPPGPGELSLETAQAIANDGDLRGAIAHLQDLLQANPEQADAHALHGFLLTEVGALQAALEAFRRATYLAPELLIAHAGAAMTARRLDQTDVARRASAQVRRLVELQPRDAEVAGWEGMTVGRLLRLFEGQPSGPIR